MKIIKPGKKPPTAICFECDYCGCVFEEEKGKCEITSQMGVMHDGLGSYNCRCPCCNHTVYSKK